MELRLLRRSVRSMSCGLHGCSPIVEIIRKPAAGPWALALWSIPSRRRSASFGWSSNLSLERLAVPPFSRRSAVRMRLPRAGMVGLTQARRRLDTLTSEGAQCVAAIMRADPCVAVCPLQPPAAKLSAPSSVSMASSSTCCLEKHLTKSCDAPAGAGFRDRRSGERSFSSTVHR